MRTRYLIFVLLSSAVLAVFFFASPAFSLLQWQATNGPYGGQVETIAISRSGAKYIGTKCSFAVGGVTTYKGGGIYRALGDEWEYKTDGLSDPTVAIFDLAVISSTTFETDRVFAATNGIGVWRSTNGADRWEDAGGGGALGDGIVYRVAVDPTNNFIFASTKNAGLKVSTDEGENWLSTGLTATFEPFAIDIASLESGKSAIYVGTFSQGIYKSTDEGKSFKHITGGYEPLEGSSGFGNDNPKVLSIAVSRSSPEVIYASVYWNPEVHKSTDEGKTWVPTTGILYGSIGYNEVLNLVVDPASPEVVYGTEGLYGPAPYGGLHKTVNGGTTWSSNQLNGYFSGEVCTDVAIDPSDRSIVWVTNSQAGVFKSTKYGQNLQSKDQGLNDLYIRALMVGTYEAGRSDIYAASEGYLGTNCGVFKSTDEGQSWQAVNNGITGSPRFHCFAQSPGDRNKILAGAEKKIFKTSDAGGSWTMLGITTEGAIYDLVFDPADSNKIYMASVSGETQFFRSTNGGSTWQSFDDGITSEVVITSIIATVSTEGTILHIAGVKGNRYPYAYRRRPADPAWSPAADGLVQWVNEYTALAPNYAVPGEIYLGGHNFLVYKKSIYANTWEVVQPTSSYVRDVKTDPNDPASIYVSNSAGDIYVLGDYGASKAREMDGLPNIVAGQIDHSEFPMSVDIKSKKLYASIPIRSVWRAITVAGLPPNAPTGLRGNALSTSSINWMWNDNAYNELGDHLFNGAVIIATIEGTHITSFEETGRSTNAPYTRRVTAYNTQGDSAFSNPFKVFTLAKAPPTPEARHIAITYIEISWEANGNPLSTSYEVWFANSVDDAPGPFSPLALISSTEYRSTGLTAETSYYYKLRALNGDGITTEFGGQAMFETLTPATSEDIYPPRITNVRFDGRPYYTNDIIYRSPRITALITDYASAETMPPITPEGVDRRSVAVKFGDWVFDWGEISDLNFTSLSTTMEALDFTVPIALGAARYTCSIEASDNAYGRWNKGKWEGGVRVMGERVDVIGTPVCYPAPFKPLSGGMVTFSYSLSTNADVDLYMYDISGQIVMTKRFRSGGEGGKAGYNQFLWSGTTDFGKVAGNGIYVFKIINGGRVIGTGKLVILD